MANQNDISFSRAAMFMFTVSILQQTTVKPPNIIAHEKGLNSTPNWRILLFLLLGKGL